MQRSGPNCGPSKSIPKLIKNNFAKNKITKKKYFLQYQLSNRFIKHRIRVFRANVGKLLCVCVPEREKWREFGWIGKPVDDILDELSK